MPTRSLPVGARSVCTARVIINNHVSAGSCSVYTAVQTVASSGSFATTTGHAWTFLSSSTDGKSGLFQRRLPRGSQACSFLLWKLKKSGRMQGYVASGRRLLHYAHLGANCFFPFWHYTQSCFETIIDLQFIENIGQMSLDGLSANKNLFADLVIRQTFGNKG